VTRAIRKSGKNAIIDLAKHYGYNLMETDFALKTSEKIASMGYEAVLFQYHGEHWLFPIFYHLNQAKGAVYLNMVPPRPRPEALPFQESTLERRIVDKLISLPFVRRFEQTSLRNVGLFITPSEFQLHQAVVQGVVGQKRAAVVPLGVDHSEFCPTGEEEPFALYVGRIHPHKSLELAMMSMKNVNSDYSLVVAGDVDEDNLQYVERLLSLAEVLKISDRFVLILRPSEAQIVRLMQSCSVFLFPSTIDTFGLVVLEAMACGKPVVACNGGGVPEIVGDSGFLLEPRSDLWHEAVAKLLSDPELRRQMGRKALVRSGAFSWGKTAKRFLASLDGIPAPN
jgi:glycosyltransferase involved in cell wall biosynthesis